MTAMSNPLFAAQLSQPIKNRDRNGLKENLTMYLSLAQEISHQGTTHSIINISIIEDN
jgi:hypothetical protein